MRTIEELVAQCPVYLNDWEDLPQMLNDFQIDSIDYKVLFASYGCASYEGCAWVLLEKDGVLYEVNGSHCSCYGLEGQFDPEPTDLKALEHRITKGSLGNDSYSGNEFQSELKQFLGLS